LKHKSKLILGIVLVAGIILLSYMSVTVTSEEPPEQDDDDPGNGRGPGIWESLPIDIKIDYEVDFNNVLNPIHMT
jgi:hypothetical protein